MKPPAAPNGFTRASQLLSSWINQHGSINWALADQAMLSGVNFFTSILLARYLGLAEFGTFTIAWLIVQLVERIQYSVVILPMISIGPKQLEHERRDYLGSVITQQAGFATVSGALFLLGIWAADSLFPDRNFGAFTWSLVTVLLISQLHNFLRRYFFAFGRGSIAMLVDFVRYAGQTAILFWLLLTVDMDVRRALWVIAGTSLASTLLSAFFVERVTWNSHNFYTTLLRHWAFSKWLLLADMMRSMTDQLHMFVVGGVIGATAVGAIRATQNLVGMSHILMLGFENVVPAGAARRLSQSGKQVLLRYLMGMLIFGASIVGTIVVVASAAAEFWLELIYGKDYVEYAQLVVWWSAIYFIVFIAQQFGVGLRTIERTKSIFWAEAVSAIISVASIYPLIIYFGLTGIMIGFLIIASVSTTILTVSFFYQFRSYNS